MNIKHYLMHPDRLISRLKLMKGEKLSDEEFINLSYYNILGRYPDLNNPQRYTEKAQWFKLHCRDLRYVPYIDKLSVRQIVSKKIGEKYLIPLYFSWKRTEDIVADSLPNEFVLKCNHDSHSVIICKNKKEFNFEAAKDKLNNALSKSFYMNSREWLYDQIAPCILCEKYMEDSNHELRDYKFWCFDGKVEFVNVFADRQKTLKIATLTREWEPAGFENNIYPPIEEKLDKPKNYHLMVEIAELLSSEFAHVRIDLYNIDGDIFFGEYTFTPASGFQTFIPDEFDLIIGSKWNLDNI